MQLNSSGQCSRLSRLVFLAFFAGTFFFSSLSPLLGAPIRGVYLASEIPVTLPRSAGSAGEIWGPMVGGALGQILTEVGRSRKSPPLPAGDYGAVKALRAAVVTELRQKRLLAPPEKAQAELRLRIMECGVFPVGVPFSSKRIGPVLHVQAQLVSSADQIVWEERRRIHPGMSKSPKIPKEEFLANPDLAIPAMEQIARTIAAELVQALITPGTGHQWDAIRR